ncbi:hypothetical protein [Deinococcus hopiensis]|uniref:Uncharacterized protein n=1 Tax=Deinococcus hopiensis KR-140 TaxID=695939 RepID=A0A1W1UM17_9DEIO|nr:hypothetical protein [Deinococcus hopiensis]SMB82127.1 hypothetical protein SAMN00790413_04855 [Deinococcus hopiensis KR-140]
MPKIPTYVEESPPHLIRSVDLEVASIQPELHQKPVTLLSYNLGQSLFKL